MSMGWRQGIRWYAVHVKRFRESAAAASISALGLEVFLPMVKADGLRSMVIKVESAPLFPSYFFARFNPEISLSAVESSRGVLQVIKSGSYPISVDDQVIEEIQNRVQADGLIQLQRREFKPGDRVSIQDGPLVGMMGRVEAEPDDRKRVAILLETLWQARVLVDKRWLEAAAA
jgi:transcriptional antiterminator RfaH